LCALTVSFFTTKKYIKRIENFPGPAGDRLRVMFAYVGEGRGEREGEERWEKYTFNEEGVD
jgi:hypothetical protein